MKKNLMSILILALLVVNIVLTAIMMFSMTGAMKSTTALVGDIAAVLALELDMGGDDANRPSMEDTVVYDIADVLTTSLQDDGSGTVHYAAVAVSLQLDSKHKDYKKYGSEEAMAAKDSIIRSIIVEVLGSHTLAEFQTDTDGIRNEILAKIQQRYQSDFIFDVVFSDVKAY
ncbi:MAG: flagellar basal body-associated FliL family protein [Lachnospiraceae bacterium]|nr:flagellar basal body-associated FliL family protein [Lachnospiraceae bacterium]